MTSDLPVLLSVAFLAFLLSYFACELMKHTGVVDAPDGARKQQAVPVPRLGGIGVIAAITIVSAAAGLGHVLAPGVLGHDWLPGQVPAVWVALAAAALLTLIGAVDDISGIGAVTKLLLVAAVCLGAPLLGVAVPAFDSPFGSISLPLLTLAGSALWLLVFTNAANFMDGSNGLSLGSLAIMVCGLGASHAAAAGTMMSPGLLVVIAAIAAFLVHNMRGGLYAGDAGAFGLGGLFALLALISGLSIWTVAILALPFLIDVLLTLLLRGRRGDAWFEAHTDHAYQVLIRAGWTHPEVAVLWWSLSAACALAATIGTLGGGALPFILFWLFAVLLAAGWLVIHRKLRHHIAR